MRQRKHLYCLNLTCSLLLLGKSSNVYKSSHLQFLSFVCHYHLTGVTIQNYKRYCILFQSDLEIKVIKISENHFWVWAWTESAMIMVFAIIYGFVTTIFGSSKSCFINLFWLRYYIGAVVSWLLAEIVFFVVKSHQVK